MHENPTTIPDPQYLREGYPILARTDLHSEVFKIFLSDPEGEKRMNEVAKLFPAYNPETVRQHIRKLRDQGAITQPRDFYYKLNPAYIPDESKRVEIARYIAEGRSRLKVLTTPQSGPYAPTTGTASTQVTESQERKVAVPATGPTTVSSAVEMLKRHLASVYRRIEAHPELFTPFDVEMLKELEIMANL